MASWIYHVDGLIATLKPVLYEGKQHTVLLVFAVEKRADVTYVAQLGTGEGDWCHGLLHGVYLALLWIARETGPLPDLLLDSVKCAPPLDGPHEQHAPLQTQRLSDFGIGLAAFTPRPWLLLATNDASSEETSIDTFVQLVSLHFSGLIAIVRSQEARLSGFKNREER